MHSNNQGHPGITKSEYLERLSLCSAQEFADRVGRSVEWVYSCGAQAGTPMLKVGKYLRFRNNRIDEWIAASIEWKSADFNMTEPCSVEMFTGDLQRLRRTFIPISEAAQLLAVPTTWFYSAARRNGFPLGKSGKYLVVSIGGLEYWMDECEQLTRASKPWREKRKSNIRKHLEQTAVSEGAKDNVEETRSRAARNQV